MKPVAVACESDVGEGRQSGKLFECGCIDIGVGEVNRSDSLHAVGEQDGGRLVKQKAVGGKSRAEVGVGDECCRVRGATLSSLSSQEVKPAHMAEAMRPAMSLVIFIVNVLK